MNVHTLSILTLCTILQIALHAAEVPSDSAIQHSYTYKGIRITPSTINQLAPATPEEIKTLITGLFNQNKDLHDIVAGDMYYEKREGCEKAPFAFNFRLHKEPIQGRYIQTFFEDLINKGERAGIVAAAGTEKEKFRQIINNITLPLTGDWLLKASGFANRRANILHEMGKDNLDRELLQEDLTRFITEHGKKTYQTISRMAYWLTLKEGIEKYNLTRIGLPKMYLVNISGKQKPISDSNYVIVEERIKGRHLKKDIDLKDPELKRQFETIIQHSDLWDNSDTNYRVSEDNKIYPIDTEQPNNQPPSNFFWLNKTV